MLNYFLLFIILFGLKDCSLQSEKNISSIPYNKLLTQKLFNKKSEIEEEEEETFYDPKESFSNSLEISEEKEKEIETFKEKLSNFLEISEEEKGGGEEIENENDLLECKPSILNKLFCLFVLISPCFASKCFVTPKGPPLNSLLKIQHIHRVEQPFFSLFLFF
ncbi:unnamed protein product [Meloidogyne enterolobii]|uniref:Uncharacterized protein n=1 Tax=Meloidogyne enterolobii TaxID=390850 RepID=A0ACB0XYQ0_MELEN